MTLSSNVSDSLPKPACPHNDSSNYNILYSSQLWSNSYLRQAIINPSTRDNKLIKYCYTCKGKIRHYNITTQKEQFSPQDHSTPKLELKSERSEGLSDFYKCIDTALNNSSTNYANRKVSISDITINHVEAAQFIPTISREVDSAIVEKFTSEYDYLSNSQVGPRSLKGRAVHWSPIQSTKTRQTQIQACSISLMIIAIIIISLILVNISSLNFNNKNDTSTNFVPTDNVKTNENLSAILNFYTDLTFPANNQSNNLLTEPTSTIAVTTISSTITPVLTTTKNNSLFSSVIFKIRKNIKPYHKDEYKRQDNTKKNEITDKSLSITFCSCQTNEVCLLDEISGKSICKVAVDIGDPTGCGGLCALETEACHLVDKARGVRICRLLTPVTCSRHDWRCRNGFCVPSEARCDGYIQCYDRSDELNCECDLTKQFRCGHSISCFPNKRKCDGFIDCWDGYDELNCTVECPKNQFTCTNGECIKSSRFCDGLADCSDKSDEPYGCDGACGTHEIQCSNHRCIPHGAQCDGRDDCGDGSDENQCS